MTEVKNLVQQEKPHILGLSECELRKSHHNISSLKLPGYELILPKSWEVHGKPRVVVYVKKTLEYEHLHELENPEIQSIWQGSRTPRTFIIHISIGNTLAH